MGHVLFFIVSFFFILRLARFSPSVGQEIMHFTLRQEKYFMNMEKTTRWSTRHHSLQYTIVSPHSNVIML